MRTILCCKIQLRSHARVRVRQSTTLFPLNNRHAGVREYPHTMSVETAKRLVRGLYVFILVYVYTRTRMNRMNRFLRS